MELNIGQPAPEIELPDQGGAMHKLSEYRGRWVLLYFYPKDDTAGCTKEACMIRDGFPDFGKLEAVVLGVSADSVESHKKFAEKYSLPFTLLSDEKKEAIGRYGVWGKKTFAGREYEGTMRTSFLIDPDGTIAKIYENVDPEAHAQEALQDVRSLREAR